MSVASELEEENSSKCQNSESMLLIEELLEGIKAEVRNIFTARGGPLVTRQIPSNRSNFHVQHKDSKQVAALKLFELAGEAERLLCKNEVELLASLQHPNIIKYIGFEEKAEISVEDKKSQNLSALLMEFAPGGEFFNVAQELGPLSEIIVRTYFSQVVSAVGYLHSNGVVHMDLKLENLLLCADDTLKLADFGSAVRVFEGQKCEGIAGTLRFQPPEALEGKLYDPFLADIFALGIMLFTLVIGSMPFGTAERSDPFYGLIYAGDMQEFWSLHKQYCDEVGNSCRNPSKGFKDLFYKLIHPDPAKRITLKELMTDEWRSLDIVDSESLCVWMNTKRRIKTKPKATL